MVVGCPCALVISTPVSVVTAIGTAARHGVLIKGGSYLEAAGSLRAIAFDKTGTLTQGKPEVVALFVPETFGNKQEVIAIAAALENGSQHPLAAAIIDQAIQEQIPFSDKVVDDFQSMTGRGVKGSIEGTPYYIGSPALFREIAPDWWGSKEEEQLKQLQQKGNTVLLLGTKQALLGIFLWPMPFGTQVPA